MNVDAKDEHILMNLHPQDSQGFPMHGSVVPFITPLLLLSVPDGLLLENS